MKKHIIAALLAFALLALAACGGNGYQPAAQTETTQAETTTTMPEPEQTQPEQPSERPAFLQYLGMTLSDMEALHGPGERDPDLRYEHHFIVYRFAGSDLRFIFPYDMMTSEISADAQCHVIMAPLREIVEPGGRERIPRAELEHHFSIDHWSDTADLAEGCGPWSNIFNIWGHYHGYHFNARLDATEEANRTSAPADAFFYFTAHCPCENI